ncbi:hypothetical protein BFP72_18025 [Reichenbachiella sp. 5M10]|uniref:TonB-dependent receptor plug domain-containing protein n=1 Tax=Reichenbachiella sp. 5M10 TaxID=1889772 RepID=UPI000C15B294|nr:TonB-dependent receptor plug domain-containing protein [Reichenbachiella sp. 5M10]PIB37169.1 hypothetical protein BFP72_18025 [Reichenbachiella sp. 5M10]
MRQRNVTIFWALALTILLYSGAAQGQSVELQFLDHETNEPIVGMGVLLQSISDPQQSVQGVTDIDGYFRTSDLAHPLRLQTQHLSYEALIETLSEAKKEPFRLQPTATVMQDVTVMSDAYQNHATDKDLYVVQEINRQTIEQLGGNDLSDVLNFNPNISVTPNASDGKSTVSMFGLSGEYVKILIDNIPVISDNGVGNDIDITQLNLDNVERIEVTEGSMGVMYGSNAIAGIINIITKKDNPSPLQISASVQEETVGSEYNWSDEGRHIQRIQLSSSINPKLTLTAGANHNDFKGFKNDHRGENYYGSEGVRGYEWNPKEQLNLNAGINYRISQSTKLAYKFAYYQENLYIHDTTLLGGVGIDGLPEYKARDKKYLTKRQVQSLSLDQQIGQSSATIFLSYQKQTRYLEDYTYDIEHQAKVSTTGLYKNQSSELIYSKGLVDNLLPHLTWLSLTTGYEFDFQRGYDAIASGKYSNNVSQQSLRNTDIFVQTDWSMIPSLTLSPGLRINNNSSYDNHLIWSMAAILKSPRQFTTQLVVGSAYKTPNYTQLYRYFVDANHDVTGNPDLEPEDGVSIMLNLSKPSHLGLVTFKNEIKGYHFNIKDKVDLALVTDADPTAVSDIQRSTYLNINQYQTIGISTSNQVQIKHLSLQLGAAYTGVRQSLENENTDEDYLFTLTGSGQLAYLFSKINTTAAVNIKYNGSNERYAQNEDGINKITVAPYTFLDASMQKNLFDNSLSIKIGARNLLDVVSVSTTGLPSSGHSSSTSTSQLFGYGRSYFVNLTYTFKK